MPFSANRNSPCLIRRPIAKTMLIMKLTAIILLSVCLQASAVGFGQKISVKVNDAPLAQVFAAIERQSEYVFFFDQSLIEKAQKVTLHASNEPLKDVLDACFKDQPFTYSIVGTTIVVKTKDVPAAEKQSPFILIKGRVVNEEQQPLVGASVLVKNGNKGASTDASGNFSLEVDPGTTLVISYVGYNKQEITVQNSNDFLNIVLNAQVKSNEDIVVIAYGNIKRGDLTGSVSQVKASEITSYPTTNVIQALSGRAAGVRVIQNNGTPGSPISVRIRGANSILGGNEPLYIVDGLPSSPTYLQNADIESMEILKDASSTAMYGSRGGNGVVMITTRSGKKNQPTSVKLDMGYSVQSITKKMKLLTPYQYVSLYNEQAVNDGLAPYFSQHQVDSFRNVKGTDWQDLLLRNAPMYNTSISVSGGSERTSYFLSGGVFSQEGIIPNSDYNRYSLRINLNHEISKIFNVAYNSTYTRSDRSSQNSQTGNRGGDMFGGMLFAPPTVGPYTADGHYTRLNTIYPFISNALINPVAIKNEVTNQIKVDDIVANLSLNIKPVNNVVIRISGNLLNSNNRNDYFTNREPYALNSVGDR